MKTKKNIINLTATVVNITTDSGWQLTVPLSDTVATVSDVREWVEGKEGQFILEPDFPIYLSRIIRRVENLPEPILDTIFIVSPDVYASIGAERPDVFTLGELLQPRRENEVVCNGLTTSVPVN